MGNRLLKAMIGVTLLLVRMQTLRMAIFAIADCILDFSRKL